MSKFLSEYRSEDESGDEDRAEDHPGLGDRHALQGQDEDGDQFRAVHTLERASVG